MIENNLLLSLDIFAAELEGPQKSGSAVVGDDFPQCLLGAYGGLFKCLPVHSNIASPVGIAFSMCL